jgi:hypothetical protein
MQALKYPRMEPHYDAPPLTKLDLLDAALRAASVAARNFAVSTEPLDQAQRERYATLAESLEAQARSLRAEV